MSGWIKFWKDMPSDPRVVTAAAMLAKRHILARKTSANGGADLSPNETVSYWRNAVTGALVTLWVYADEHIHADDTLELTSETLDAIVGLEGFFSAIPRDWVDELEDGRIVLPGYCEKNLLIAKRKRKAKSNARVTQWRLTKKRKSNARVTHDVTQHTRAGDLDQDLDIEDKDKRGAARPTIDYSLVDNLDQDAWAIWLAYRRRAKIKTYVDTRMAVRLATYPPEIQRLAVIESITQNYSGLFPEKVKPQTNGATNGAHQGNRRESSYESAGRKLDEWAEQHGLVRDGVGYRAA